MIDRPATPHPHQPLPPAHHTLPTSKRSVMGLWRTNCLCPTSRVLGAITLGACSGCSILSIGSGMKNEGPAPRGWCSRERASGRGVLAAAALVVGGRPLLCLCLWLCVFVCVDVM